MYLGQIIFTFLRFRTNSVLKMFLIVILIIEGMSESEGIRLHLAYLSE